MGSVLSDAFQSPGMHFNSAFISLPAVYHQIGTTVAKSTRHRKYNFVARNRNTVRASISEPPSVERVLGEQAEKADNTAFSWTEQWYAVHMESNAPVDEPFAFQIFDMELVLFRSAPGRWSVLDDRCSHRLAPLSEGRVTQLPDDDNGEAVLECAYHGWSFKSCGQCARIPQIEKCSSGATIPRRADVRSYPTKVEFGLIWVWLGDPENADTKSLPVPPSITEFKDDEKVVGFTRYVPYGSEIFLENVADMEHTHYAHHGVSGEFNRVNGGQLNIFGRQTGVDTIAASRTRKEDASQTAEEIGGFLGPGSMYYNVEIRDKMKFLAWFCVTPVTRTKSHIFVNFYARVVNASPLIRFLMKLKPTWYDHFERNNILDGDNLMLRSVQRKAGDPSTWPQKYLPVGGFDGFVLALKKWMDVNRDAMPWKSDPSTENAIFEALSREELNERYYSHTIHCNACRGALKGFERAAIVADWVAKFGIVGLISIAASAFVGNAGAILGLAEMNMLVVGTGLAVLTVVALLARWSFLWFKAQFISSDEARRRYLETPLGKKTTR